MKPKFASTIDKPESNHDSIWQNESGFTIIELLAVTVLLALMSTILYSSLSAVLNGRELVSARKKVMLTAEHIFSQLSSDLAARESITLDESSTQNSTQNTTQNSTNANPTLASGFSGFGVRKFMSCEDSTISNASADTLNFVTHSFPITVVSEVRNFGLIEVLYKLEELPRDLVDSDQEVPTFRLLRQETPAAVSEKKTREYHQATNILADSITEFNLRFRINGKWSDKWSATGGRAFPEAIEISVGILDEEQNPHLFRTAIAISKRPQGPS